MKRAPILAVIWLSAAAPFMGGCAGPTNSMRAAGVGQPAPPMTFSQRLGQAFKKTGEAFTIKPKIIPAADPIGLASNPKHVDADVYYGAGQLFEKKGDVASAIGQYKQALSSNPEDIKSMQALARLYTGQGDIDAAVAMYRQALAVKPDDLQSLHELARLYDRQEDFRSATEVYRRALSAHPGKGVLLNDLGLCYARQGDVPRALESMSAAVQADPSSKLYRNNLATVMVEAGYPDQALQHFTAAHGPAVANYNLGLLLYQQGDQQAAARYLRQAIQLDSSLQPAQALLIRIEGPASAARPSGSYPSSATAAPAGGNESPVAGRASGNPAAPSYAEVRIPDMRAASSYSNAQLPPQPDAYSSAFQTSAYPRALPPVQ